MSTDPNIDKQFEALHRLRDANYDLDQYRKALAIVGLYDLASRLTGVMSVIDESVATLDEVYHATSKERLHEAQAMTGTILSALLARAE